MESNEAGGLQNFSQMRKAVTAAWRNGHKNKRDDFFNILRWDIQRWYRVDLENCAYLWKITSYASKLNFL